MMMGAMSGIRLKERRSYSRLPISWKVTVRELVSTASSDGENPAASGSTKDICQGGLCFSSDHLLTVAALARCEVTISELLFPITTLVQVRWSIKEGVVDSYLTGLQFVL
jgi:hypothetical protein